jgi:hypothetical protein
MDYLIFPFHLVCSFRQQFAWWLLAHDEFMSISGDKLVRRVRLAKAKLRCVSADLF